MLVLAVCLSGAGAALAACCPAERAQDLSMAHAHEHAVHVPAADPTTDRHTGTDKAAHCASWAAMPDREEPSMAGPLVEAGAAMLPDTPLAATGPAPLVPPPRA